MTHSQRVVVLSLTSLMAIAAAALTKPATGTAQRVQQGEVAKIDGLWQGQYSYPAGEDKPPVRFQVMVSQNGSKIAGFMKEPNTFGNQGEPWLHAVLKGIVNENGKLTAIKTYDGTAGQNHDVRYNGQVARDGKKIQGTWNIN